MADDVTLNAGSGGDTIAADDIAGVKFQRVKIALGANNTNDGDVASGNPMPVTGTVAVTNAGITTIAGAVSGTEMQVDVLTSALPTGAATEAKQPALGTAGTASADVITVQGIASMTPLLVNGSGVTQPVSGTVTANLAAGTNNIGDVDVLSIAAGDNNIGNVDIVTVPAPLSTTGGGTEATALRVTIASDSTGVLSIDDNGGVITVDQSGTWTVQPGNTANTTAWLVSQRPATSGGLTIFRSLDLDETEEEIKSSAGQIYGWYLFNAAASTRYVKFYNATAANTTVGTTTPILTVPVPAGSAANVEFSNGIAFATALSVAATTGVADADTGAPAANDVIVNVLYA